MEIAMREPDQGDASGQRSWSRRPIDDRGLVITRKADSTLRVDPVGFRHGEDEVANPIALILPHGTGELRAAVMLVPNVLSPGSREGRVLLNGYPPLAVTELLHGTEISIGADSLVFRETRSALSETFDSDSVEHCARCKQLLEGGDSIRRCGTCLSPHHEGTRANSKRPQLFCASYDPLCGRCGARFEEATPNSEEERDAD